MFEIYISRKCDDSKNKFEKILPITPIGPLVVPDFFPFKMYILTTIYTVFHKLMLKRKIPRLIFKITNF